MDAYNRRIHYLFQLLIDSMAIAIAWECTIRLRVFLNPVLFARVTLTEAQLWVPPLILILPLWVIASLFERKGNGNGPFFRFETFRSLGEATFRLGILAVLVTFFSREFGSELSRLFVLLLFPVSFLALGLSRYTGTSLRIMLHKRWLPPVRVALIGNAMPAFELMSRVDRAQFSTFVCGVIVPEGNEPDDLSYPVPVLGTTDQLAELINREKLDQIILVNNSMPQKELERCNRVIARMGLPVSCAVDFAPESVRLDVSHHLGLPLVRMTPVRFRRAQEIVKRCLDVGMSASALIGLGPLMLVLALLIRVTSKGPVLYKAARVGKGGRHFTFLKFRSMYHEEEARARVAAANEKSGHIFKIRQDPRITPIGRILRRYSLDELPQLINILRGEMSIVGPRPLPARDLDPDGMSRQFGAWSEGRARVQPGLTGLWQIKGRSDLSFEDMIRFDLEYIESWSLSLDINIILSTPMLVLRGVGAY